MATRRGKSTPKKAPARAKASAPKKTTPRTKSAAPKKAAARSEAAPRAQAPAADRGLPPSLAATAQALASAPIAASAASSEPTRALDAAPHRRSGLVADALVVARPALACLELATIARGIVVLDQMAKRAETTIVAARTMSPGRYLIVLSGSEAEIEEAVAAGLETAKEDLVDHVIIHDPAEELREALKSAPEPVLDESLAIIETATVTTAILAADRTLKGAEVHLLELRLGAGLGGKGLFTLTGPLHMILAAKDVLESSVPLERVIRVEVIAQPHPDLPKHLLDAEVPATRGPRHR